MPVSSKPRKKYQHPNTAGVTRPYTPRDVRVARGELKIRKFINRGIKRNKAPNFVTRVAHGVRRAIRGN